MLVNDKVEIGTSECRLSSEQCGCDLIAMRVVAVIASFKPTYICSRVSRAKMDILSSSSAHYHGSSGYTLC